MYDVRGGGRAANFHKWHTYFNFISCVRENIIYNKSVIKNPQKLCDTRWGGALARDELLLVMRQRWNGGACNVETSSYMYGNIYTMFYFCCKTMVRVGTGGWDEEATVIFFIVIFEAFGRVAGRHRDDDGTKERVCAQHTATRWHIDR